MDKNVQFDIYFDCVSTAGVADTTTAPTVERSLDGGNYAVSTNSATRIQSTHTFKLTLTADEMNTTCTIVKITGVGLLPRVMYLFPEANWLTAKAGYLTGSVALDSTVAKAATALSNAIWTDAKAGYLTGVIALEATLTAIKGVGWSTETLAAIDALIDAIKAKTDLIPASPAAVGSAMTLQAGHGLALDSTVAKDATVSKLTAQQVWEYASRSLTTFGTLIADIWEYATRTLTSGGSLTAQETRDALKLAPSAGAAATDSIDDKLDGISDTTDQFVFTGLGKVDASAEATISQETVTEIIDGVIAGVGGGGTIVYTNTIEYPTGTPLPCVEVHCCSDSLGQSIIASTFTDDLGAFTFYLVAGTYYIAIQHPQFQGSLTAITVS